MQDRPGFKLILFPSVFDKENIEKNIANTFQQIISAFLLLEFLFYPMGNSISSIKIMYFLLFANLFDRPKNENSIVLKMKKIMPINLDHHTNSFRRY